MYDNKMNFYADFIFLISLYNKDKRPTGLNGHLSIGDFTLNSCQKGAYFFISAAPLLQ